MPAILFVCTANQCRSPMAMALMRKRLEDSDLDDVWTVDSAGTWGFDGAPATASAIETVQEWGVDLKDHRSRKVTEEILRRYDLILTMEHRHKEALKVDFPRHAERVFMLSEMVAGVWDVRDPIGGPVEEYQKTATKLDLVLERGMETILETARGNASGRGKEGKAAS